MDTNRVPKSGVAALSKRVVFTIAQYTSRFVTMNKVGKAGMNESFATDTGCHCWTYIAVYNETVRDESVCPMYPVLKSYRTTSPPIQPAKKRAGVWFFIINPRLKWGPNGKSFFSSASEAADCEMLLLPLQLNGEGAKVSPVTNGNLTRCRVARVVAFSDLSRLKTQTSHEDRRKYGRK